MQYVVWDVFLFKGRGGYYLFCLLSHEISIYNIVAVPFGDLVNPKVLNYFDADLGFWIWCSSDLIYKPPLGFFLDRSVLGI